MKFYTYAYHLHNTISNTTIVIFAYDEQRRKVALTVNYHYQFYVEKGKGLKEIIDAHCEGTRLDLDNVYHYRSTIDLHTVIPVMEVFCTTQDAMTHTLSVLRNHGYKCHEYDHMLSPILKFTTSKGITRYCWIEADVTRTNTYITKRELEYIVDVNSVKKVSTDMVPIQLSKLSFDIETYSAEWNKAPSAVGGIDNAVRIIGNTFSDGDRYEEHIIVFGPDISDVYKEYMKDDVSVYIHTCATELDLLNKFFELIIVLDPDICVGHNTTGFDYQYIKSRYTLLTMSKCKQTRISTHIPNMSVMNNYKGVDHKIDWNNNQVAVSGTYPNMPGRIWQDTCILSNRNFFGSLPNNKLDTLGEVVLGMNKNNVSYIKMFTYFKLYMDWCLLARPDCPFDRDEIESQISKEYGEAVKIHNKNKLPRISDNQEISVSDINELIRQVNDLDQRGTKIDLEEEKNVKLGKIDVKSTYNRLYDRYVVLLNKWNIEYQPNIPIKRKIEFLFLFVALYCMQDTRIPYQACLKRGIDLVLCEQANVFAITVEDVQFKGQVYTVTCSQYSCNKEKDTMMDFGIQGGPLGAYDYGGGFVGKGEPGMKTPDNDCIVMVLDFASLYPTIIIAYNLCYTTYVPENMRDSNSADYIWHRYADIITSNIEKYKKLISDGKDVANNSKYLSELELVVNSPLDQRGARMCNIFKIADTNNMHWFLKESVMKGNVPAMLWRQFLARKAVKGRASDEKKKGNFAMASAYDAQQLAIKVSMNSTYGGFGTKSNRLANFAVAETVTFIGRTSILTCNSEIEKRGLDTVVYNDTDSAMIRVPNITSRFNRDVNKIKDYGNNLAKELSNKFRYPMSLECENFFVSFFLKKPKMYAAIKWNWNTVDIKSYTESHIKMFNLLYIKGMAPARKDKYKYNKELLKYVLMCILTHKDYTVVKSAIERAVINLWKFRGSLAKVDESTRKRIAEMLSYNMSVSVKAYSGSSATMGNWVRIYEAKYGSKPSSGTRFELLVTNVASDHPDKDKHTKTASKLVTMDWLLEENRTLDIIHYILAMEADGNVVEIASIAYPNYIKRKCIEKYYLRKCIESIK